MVSISKITNLETLPTHIPWAKLNNERFINHKYISLNGRGYVEDAKVSVVISHEENTGTYPRRDRGVDTIMEWVRLE